MTEIEAKTKWCPMIGIARRDTIVANGKCYASDDPNDTRLVGDCDTGDLGHNIVPASCRCVGSKCAMWMWLPLPERKTIFADSSNGAWANTAEEMGMEAPPGYVFQKCQPIGKINIWYGNDKNNMRYSPAFFEESDELLMLRREGYCGIAGKPGVYP